MDILKLASFTLMASSLIKMGKLMREPSTVVKDIWESMFIMIKATIPVCLRMMFQMAQEYLCGQIKQDTKANGKRGSRKEGECKWRPMERNIKVFGRMGVGKSGFDN